MKILDFAARCLKLFARWLGPALLLLGLGLAVWMRDIPVFPVTLVLPGLAALVSAIAWFATRAQSRRSRPLLAISCVIGLLFCAWTFWDQTQAYREVTVSFENRGARLVGTLYIPNRAGRTPGMVMLHGSESGPRAKYKVHVHHFARRGYVVLAYDKRGFGESSGQYTGDYSEPCLKTCQGDGTNVELLASDAAAALTFLAARREVDADRVGYWGVSQGGITGPRAALMNGRARFMMFVNGPATSAHDNTRFQNFLGNRESKRFTPDQAYELARRMGEPIDLPNFDPAPDLNALNIPGLWLMGERDFAVPPGSTIAVLAKLKRQGKPYEYHVIPGARHGIDIWSHADLSGLALSYRIMDAWLARVTSQPAPAQDACVSAQTRWSGGLNRMSDRSDVQRFIHDTPARCTLARDAAQLHLASLPVPLPRRPAVQPVRILATSLMTEVGRKWRAGQEFDDCNGTAWCPRMVVVPAGSFMMGSPESERGNDPDETQRRRVNIRQFAVGKFEVTFDQWDECVRRGGCDNTGPQQRGGDNGWGRGTRPVIEMGWEDAQAYVRWLSRETRRSYRLLTEAEWEYTARAGTTTRYSWGEEDPVCDRGARNGANFILCPGRRTMPVGSYAANAFGLYDMHGNAWEWVQDCYISSYSGLPTDGSAASVPSCVARVHRGGSWSSYPPVVRSAYRCDDGAFTCRGFNSGFRVARMLH